MKKFFCVLSVVLLLSGCSKDSKTYFVRYTAEWQNYSGASTPFIGVYCRIGDSVIYQGFSDPAGGSWSYDYEAKPHDTLMMSFHGIATATSTNTLKIFLNDKLEKSGKDEVTYIVTE